MGKDPSGKRLLFVMNSARYFVLNRLGLARAARDAGYQVHVAVVNDDFESCRRIQEEGLHLHLFPMNRRSFSVWNAARSFFALNAIIRRIRPDLVHSLTIKAVILSGGLCRWKGLPMVALIPGRGTAFTSGGWMSRLATVLYRYALGSAQTRAIFQNDDDFSFFIAEGMVSKEKARLVRGSGVELQRFPYTEHSESQGPRTILLAARMLKEKGVGEFLQAAKHLRATRTDLRFVMAGAPDPGNPHSLDADELKKECAESGVEWLGHVQDMPKLLREADVFCLPTYYPEGVPMTLLQAASTGLPLISTDVPGCRDVVLHEETGLVVPPRSAEALADAMRELVDQPEKSARLGQRARSYVEEEFSDRVVYEKTLEIYGELA